MALNVSAKMTGIFSPTVENLPKKRRRHPFYSTIIGYTLRCIIIYNDFQSLNVRTTDPVREISQMPRSLFSHVHRHYHQAIHPKCYKAQRLDAKPCHEILLSL